MSLKLPLHENKVFEGQTVYATGHAYVGCRFSNCTMILTNGPGILQNCSFSGCNFQLDYLVLAGDPSGIQFLRELCNLMEGGGGGGITFSHSTN